MGAYDQGVVNPYDFSSAVVIPIEGVAINFLVNRTPLYSNLGRVPKGAMSFKTTADNYRAGTATVNGTITSGVTTLVVTDGSPFMVGDVLETSTGEAVIVTADPAGNSLTIARGYAGTSAASITDATTLYLIGNTRTGGEVNQTGISRVPTVLEQYLQTSQFPYQVSGALQSATDFALPPGMATFLGRERAYAVQQCADDLERSMYYGVGKKAGAATDRQQMIGLRGLLTTNKTLSPTNAGTYQPSDFVRDVTKGPLDNGGRVDLALVASDFQLGFMKWGMPLVRLDAGATKVGVHIDMFSAPFLNDVAIVLAPHLRPGTVVGLTSAEVFLGDKRAMFDKARGSRGDAYEGDVIAEAAIEVHNQQHHSWTSGITAFAPES